MRIFISLVAAFFMASAANAGTLEDVKARGVLNCIVNTGLPGFSYTDKTGRWKGFDADMCRSVAAAVLGDGEKVKFIPATGKTRFTLLNSKEGDVIFRNTTWTFVRDVDVKLNFIGTTYYDGQGFMIRKNSGVTSAKQLDGATVCIQTGTTTELNLADFSRNNSLDIKPITFEDGNVRNDTYLQGGCDALTNDKSGLASNKAAFPNPGDHVVLPETISKEPLGPVVADGDTEWAQAVEWPVMATVQAWEFGLDSGNIGSYSGDNPNILNFIGSDNFDPGLGLPSDFAVQVVTQVGNYEEIFNRHIPAIGLVLVGSPNNIWTDGGLMYVPPYR